jgi:CBS domain-containing protein
MALTVMIDGVGVPLPLLDASKRVKNGEEVRVTSRTLLAWFRKERRGSNITRRIRKALDAVRVRTEPDFEGEWIDTEVALCATEEKETATLTQDPVHRIKQLDSANRAVVAVKPDEPLPVAVTLMLAGDFSQLPVMCNERDVRGVISWKTIAARQAAGHDPQRVRDCLEPAEVVEADAPRRGISATRSGPLGSPSCFSGRSRTNSVSSSGRSSQWRRYEKPPTCRRATTGPWRVWPT